MWSPSYRKEIYRSLEDRAVDEILKNVPLIDKNTFVSEVRSILSGAFIGKRDSGGSDWLLTRDCLSGYWVKDRTF
jgi:hypothetical protein